MKFIIPKLVPCSFYGRCLPLCAVNLTFISINFYHRSNKTNDDTVLDLVNDTLKYLPPRVDFNTNDFTADLMNPKRGSITPDRLRQVAEKKLSQDPLAEHADQSAFVTVLRQEINRFDRLLGIIYTSLSSLRLAVKGEVLMSEQLEEAYDALLSNRVPKAWVVCIIHGVSQLFNSQN